MKILVIDLQFELAYRVTEGDAEYNHIIQSEHRVAESLNHEPVIWLYRYAAKKSQTA